MVFARSIVGVTTSLSLCFSIMMPSHEVQVQWSTGNLTSMSSGNASSVVVSGVSPACVNHYWGHSANVA